jgi:DNA-binding CsgD family transcriptional regulator
MNQDRFFDDRLCELAAAATYEDMTAVVHAMRDHYGVRNLTYRKLRQEGAGKVSSRLALSTVDPEWFRQYEAREFIEIDPVVNAAWQSPLPLDWDGIDRRSRNARYFFSEVDRHELGDRGLTIPISPINKPPGLLTILARGLSDLEWRAQKRRCEADLLLFANHIHFHALRLDERRPADPLLTDRGHVCLEMVLNGHKPALIGKLLGLSIHTVRMHLRHAQERLHCQSLPEAVGKAVELGIIKKTAQIMSYGLLVQCVRENSFLDVASALAA